MEFSWSLLKSAGFHYESHYIYPIIPHVQLVLLNCKQKLPSSFLPAVSDQSSLIFISNTMINFDYSVIPFN
jgi:hypothetical protein